jgi:hypothetical protein
MLLPLPRHSTCPLLLLLLLLLLMSRLRLPMLLPRQGLVHHLHHRPHHRNCRKHLY